MVKEPLDPQRTDEDKPAEGTREPMGGIDASQTGQGTQGTNAQQDTEGQPTSNPIKP